MEIKSVFDREFAPYGRVAEGYDRAPLLAAMERIQLPEEGTAYDPSIPALEDCAPFQDLQDRAFGGMPIQIGACRGRNTRLNCLEYHRDSEFNLGTEDFILLLAKREEIEDDGLDTARVRAFRVPAGTLVEVYATTLHYAPCHCDPGKGFRVAVVLPRGTNTQKPAISGKTAEDRRLWARNKWLLAHPDSAEAKRGAWIGLRGENIDVSRL